VDAQPPARGITALGVFFAFGAVVAGVTCIALVIPGGGLEPIWRLNPQARVAFSSMGPWAIVLMCVVSAACALTATGLWLRARWGHRLALAVLGINLLGDTMNAFVRGDLRTLIGLPIGGAMIAYLLRADVRRRFAPAKSAERTSLDRPAST
jgi:hypothetical protein